MNNVADQTILIEQYEAEIAKLKDELNALEEKYEWLTAKYLLKVKKVFGRSREHVDGQMVIEGVFNEAEVEADNKLPDPSVEEVMEPINKVVRKYKGQKSDKLSGLPVERVEYELPEETRTCEKCGEPLPELAPIVIRRIEVIPVQVKVVENVRHIYAGCKCEVEPQIVNAPMPEPALSHSIATESTIAFVIVQKYQYGLPLNRQEEQWRMLDLRISRQTMANWVILATDLWLKLVYDRMHQLLIHRDIVMADETGLLVLREKDRPATAKSFMWLYRSGRDGPPIVLFDYQTTRAAKHPEKFLDGFGGYIITDAYAGYNGLKSVIHCSCWSHARRYFFDAFKSAPKKTNGKPCDAEIGLNFCDKLFDIEREYRDVEPQKRYEVRLVESMSVLNEFKEWLRYMNPRVSSKSYLGKAVNYCNHHWESLCNFLKDGRLEIDNNRSERDIRKFVNGRKGWLFSTSINGASASAISYSIVLTARENGLDPYDYLVCLLKGLPNSNVKDQDVLDSFLPWSESIQASCKLKKTIPPIN